MKRFSRELWLTTAMIAVATVMAVVLNRPIAGAYCLAMGFVIFLFAWFVPEIKLQKRWSKELLLGFNACLGYVLVEATTGNLLTVTVGNAAINILFIYVFQKLLETLLGSVKGTTVATLFICLLIGLAEYYVMRFRGSPIVPWDLMVLDTAATVAADYTFHYPKEIYFCVMMCVGFAAFMMKFSVPMKANRAVRLQNGVVTLVGALVMTVGVYPRLDTEMWRMESLYETQGFVASFVANLTYMHNPAPEGYSEEYVQSVLDEVPLREAYGEVQAQNVIIVMNESYADFRLINDELVGDEFMPKWDARTENTMKGVVHVPVFGAGTCDTEFEALTGMSVKYTGSYSYVLKVNHETESIARHFAAEGFHTMGYHPYYAANWRRTWVYPLFGFDLFHGIEDTSNIDYVRWKVRDDCNYENVIEYEENSASDKFFMYNVTMQNHGGYSDVSDDLVITADLSALGGFSDAETYLSLVQLSDEAIDELITHYENSDEPTLICVFGDHQPKIEAEYYETLFGKPLETLSQEEQLKRFQTPIMFWANYDLPEQDLGHFSINYLAPLVLQYAGYSPDAYYSFLLDLKEAYPVLNQNAVIDAQGHILTKAEESESTLLKDYQMICHYLINGGTLEY